MISYQTDGRDAALAELKVWMGDNLPKAVVTADNLNFTKKSVREKVLNEKVLVFKEKARISQTWRDELSTRLRIQDEDVIRATNTIFELIEAEVSKGGTVRLAGFGDLKTKQFEEGPQLYFQADEAWTQELNEPLYEDGVGLKRQYVKKKLTRRAI